MTDKEIVLAKYPKANYCSTTGYISDSYKWGSMRIGAGDTEVEAWADAAKRIKEAA